MLLAAVMLVASAPAASADISAFIGSTTSPVNRPVRGFAVGAGILIVGFEFEYADTAEDAPSGAPALRTGMGNVLLQTPLPIAGFQPYLTTGAGGYREQLGGNSTTNIGLNSGGGVKITLAGPLRVRFDYRVFRLSGNPRVDVVQRLYVGANLAF
jgi:opacity protein-like surface antigen